MILEDNVKACSNCKLKLSSTNFWSSSNKRGGRGKTLNAQCKACRTIKQRAYRLKNREKHLQWMRDYHKENKIAFANNRLLRKYGITYDEKIELMEQQGFECAICYADLSNVSEAFVDHDHTSGKVRGILCSNCNSGLGFFKDQVELMINAGVYLDSRRNIT